MINKTVKNGLTTKQYGQNEELMNTLTHVLGVIFGIIGLILLVKNHQALDLIQFIGVTIYGLSIILLFLCSSLYHGSQSKTWKKRFKLLDHCAIYLLIAGTYTPLLLITLKNADQNWILITIWILALMGIVFKVMLIHRFKRMSVIFYLGMGWLCVAVLPDLIAQLSTTEFNLFIAGGLSYSIGVIFYITEKIPFNHAIWHLFVLSGATCHFLCIYSTVLRCVDLS